MLTKKVSKRKLIKIIGFSALGSMSYGLFNLLSEKRYVKSKWTGIVLNNETELVIHSNNNKNNYYLQLAPTTTTTTALYIHALHAPLPLPLSTTTTTTTTISSSLPKIMYHK